MRRYPFERINMGSNNRLGQCGIRVHELTASDQRDRGVRPLEGGYSGFPVVKIDWPAPVK